MTGLRRKLENTHPHRIMQQMKPRQTPKGSHGESRACRRLKDTPSVTASTGLIQLHYDEYSTGLPYSVFWDRSNVSRDRHVHDFHEIAIITHGVGRHVSQYADWPVQAGDVLVIGGRQAHSYDQVQNLEIVNILFQHESLKRNAGDLAELDGYQALFGVPNLRSHREFRSHFRLAPKDFGVLLSHVKLLQDELVSHRKGRSCFSQLHFLMIVGTLSRAYCEQENLDTNLALRLAKVIGHMEDHLTDNLSIKHLAKWAGLSERQLQRHFNLGVGASPVGYLLQLRLNRAVELLRNPNLHITEVAFSVGFNDSNYFTRQFKKRMGLSPQDFRREVMPNTTSFKGS